MVERPQQSELVIRVHLTILSKTGFIFNMSAFICDVPCLFESHPDGALQRQHQRQGSEVSPLEDGSSDAARLARSRWVVGGVL